MVAEIAYPPTDANENASRVRNSTGAVQTGCKSAVNHRRRFHSSGLSPRSTGLGESSEAPFSSMSRTISRALGTRVFCAAETSSRPARTAASRAMAAMDFCSVLSVCWRPDAEALGSLPSRPPAPIVAHLRGSGPSADAPHRGRSGAVHALPPKSCSTVLVPTKNGGHASAFPLYARAARQAQFRACQQPADASRHLW